MGNRVTALENVTGLKTIKTVTLSADCSTYRIDVSDIDFSQWNKVHLSITLKSEGYAVPQLNSATYTQALTNTAAPANSHFQITFLPTHDGAIATYGFIAPWSNTFFSTSIPFSALTGISFAAASGTTLTLKSGTVFRFLGEK